MVAVTLNNLASLANQTSAITTINANNAAITSGFTDCLSVNDTTSNTMAVDLNMNGQNLINLPFPASNTEPVRLEDFAGLLTSSGLPANTTLTFAAPAGTVGTAVAVGTATTAMRSDAAPPISQSITPTWTGKHIFSGEVDLNSTVKINGTTETFPASGIMVGTTDAQTLTNKTLTTPIISSISNTGTLTLPTTTQTLVGRTTTDTLTNKTLTSPTITSPTITGTGSATLNSATINGNISVTGTSSQTGTITAGADVQATGYFKSGGFNKLSSDVNYTSNTTYSNTGLSVNLTSGVNYMFEVVLFHTSGAGGGFNLKTQMSGTATASTFWANGIGIDDGGNLRAPSVVAALGTTIVAANVGTTTNCSIMLRGYIACNGTGTLTVQAAQQGSTATTSTVKAGSHMMVHQVA